MAADLTFSHFGIFVRDPETMSAFYKNVLGFVETDRGRLAGRLMIFLSRDPDEHHQIIFVSGLTRAPQEEVVNQISLRLPTLEQLQEFYRRLVALAVPGVQATNHGNAWSVYFRDPEGNRVEVTTSSPWYVNQPCREPLDMALSADEIRRASEDWCRAQPSFRPAAEFRAEIARKI